MLSYMEQQRLTKSGRFRSIIALVLLFIATSCIGIRMGSEINLGGGYYYVQDYPQCICHNSKPGKVVLPIDYAEEIVVRVQYNDSVIIAVCSPDYYSKDSTMYKIEKRTGSIVTAKDIMSDSGNEGFKEIKNSRRYNRRTP